MAQSLSARTSRTSRRTGGSRAAGSGLSSLKRTVSKKAAWVVLVLSGLHAAVGVWYVHHPRTWLEEKASALPSLVAGSLEKVGYVVGDVTDALGLTGEDAVYEYDVEAPSNSVFFAGAPVRRGPPAPTDIKVLNRGEFVVGYSPSLRHPAWCAYHVPREARYPSTARPDFKQDKSVGSPSATAYAKSGYDRGHMVPNYAIVTRFGPEAQKKTFLMSNIAPQSAALNRGVWRDVEHRIAEFWTARYGEVWVIVGPLFTNRSGKTVNGGDINVPDGFYQIVVAQEGMEVRALAMVFEQDVPSDTWAMRYLTTIDDIEARTGLDFLPDLDDSIERPLEAQLPTRLWPICKLDVLKQLFSKYVDD